MKEELSALETHHSACRRRDPAHHSFAFTLRGYTLLRDILTCLLAALDVGAVISGLLMFSVFAAGATSRRGCGHVAGKLCDIGAHDRIAGIIHAASLSARHLPRGGVPLPPLSAAGYSCALHAKGRMRPATFWKQQRFAYCQPDGTVVPARGSVATAAALSAEIELSLAADNEDAARPTEATEALPVDLDKVYSRDRTLLTPLKLLSDDGQPDTDAPPVYFVNAHLAAGPEAPRRLRQARVAMQASDARAQGERRSSDGAMSPRLPLFDHAPMSLCRFRRCTKLWRRCAKCTGPARTQVAQRRASSLATSTRRATRPCASCCARRRCCQTSARAATRHSLSSQTCRSRPSPSGSAWARSSMRTVRACLLRPRRRARCWSRVLLRLATFVDPSREIQKL
eukprot:3407957-Pleurochrysis_carterae.AAC.4